MGNEENDGTQDVRQFDASGAARVARTLRGDMPRIDAVAILSAANPVGKSLSTREQSQCDIALRHDLVGYTVRQIKGRYGPLENPYLIPNIDRKEIIGLAARRGQASIIYGQRHGEGAVEGLQFDWISTSDEVPGQPSIGHVIATRMICLARTSDAAQPPAHQARNDWTEHTSQPFVIPFFDDGAVTSTFRGGRVLCYFKDEFPDTSKVQEALERFIACDQFLTERLHAIARGERFTDLHQRRGIHHLRLCELYEAVGDWKPFPMFSWEDDWNDAVPEPPENPSEIFMASTPPGFTNLS